MSTKEDNDHGYCNSAKLLRSEARLSDDQELCDNIDLDSIYLEYSSFHHLKFGKYPKVLRKTKPTIKIDSHQIKKCSKIIRPNQSPPPKSPSAEPVNNLQIVVKHLDTGAEKGEEFEGVGNAATLKEIEAGVSTIKNELLGNPDWQVLVELVKTTILTEDLKLSWNDMCGNSDAITTLKEAVETPIKYPELFVDGMKPWKSALLYGPPGSGKTFLAKILYSETRQHVTFFNVSSSVLISKWRGESEKILKVLFYVARTHAPSILFFDEIEGITSKRDRPGDHESTKRFKNELLQLLDGIEQYREGTFILASTNLPWDIDEAFLRRFEKKLLVQLPNPEERSTLINKFLPATLKITEFELESLVNLTENFTGDELRLACKEVAMQNLRQTTAPNDFEKVPLENAFKKIKPLSLRTMGKHLHWQQHNGT